MDALEAIEKRQSIRSFEDKPLSKDILEKIVNTGRLAATARNVQPWEFVVVTDRDKLKEIAELTDYGKFIAEAAACIAVFCQDTKYYLEDGSAATQNMLVAATALGVGSCWVAGDKKPYCGKIASLLGVPEGVKLVSLIALGYPKEVSGRASKRALSEVIHWEKY